MGIFSIPFRKQLPEAEWLSLAGGDLSYEGIAGDARTWTFPAVSFWKLFVRTNRFVL